MTTTMRICSRNLATALLDHFLGGLMRLAITRPGMTGGNFAQLKSAPVAALGYAASISAMIALKLALF
jgi:hypothetical protein